MDTPKPSPGRFRNSDLAVVIGDFPWYEMVWRSLRGDFKPKADPEGGYDAFAKAWSVAPDLTRLHQRQQAPVVTWLGHVSVLLQVAGLNILTDPTLADFAGPGGRVGAKRRVPAPLKPQDLPPIDAVLISHNHYDHLCDATITQLLASGQRPHFYVPQGLKPWFVHRGIAEVTEMGWWDQAQQGPLRLHFTPAQHWSRRTPFDTNASLWGGYMVEWERGTPEPWRFLFPGDTGYSADFKAIRQRIGAVDFLALPIGAYLPRDFMKPMHVNPADAVQMMLDLDAQQCMGVHWGTFMLTQESFDQPPRDLAVALQERGLPQEKVWLMRHGETRVIPLP
ncbi:MBL fold metallo-hydrolase [Rhodoferax saidenbachensis]|uniref:Phospholipase n=1 Tax=Rhodoferax saidenbachensis TaxID=1484693 RepID=A0A1P8K8H2_9BURK|nr:MBL fold metallo-hydrolase [Rhodoferax saidenbachensis]APW42297.1 phospholipase [Rhodoferax saidenbachensis]